MSALSAALRQLRQHPGFGLITVLVLGLGTGSATAVFTVVDAVVLRPLPYEEPDRLVTIWDTNAAQALSHDPISPVNFMDQRALPVFEDAAAWWRPGVNLTDPDRDPMRVTTIEASGNLFDVLGIRPQLGDGFPAGGPLFARGEPLAVISDRLWRERFGGDRGILGRPILLNGSAYLVAGVMPAGFHYPDDVDVWQRLQWDMTQHSRQAHFMEAVAQAQGWRDHRAGPERRGFAVDTARTGFWPDPQQPRQGLGLAAGPPAGRTARLLSPGLDGAVRRGGPAPHHRRPQRRLAAPHPLARARARNRRACGPWGLASPVDPAVDGREPRPLGRGRHRRDGRGRRRPAPHPRRHAGRDPTTPGGERECACAGAGLAGGRCDHSLLRAGPGAAAAQAAGRRRSQVG